MSALSLSTMDFPPPEKLQFVAVLEILSESLKIPRSSPKTFSVITLTLVFPLSYAILAHSLFTRSLLQQVWPNHSPLPSIHQLFLPFLLQFIYLIFLFAFSLLSTAAVVFTVASLYTAKPVSFSSTLSAIPRIFKRLFITYLYVSLLLILYNLVFFPCFILFLVTENFLLILLSFLLILVLLFVVQVYITALWHVASVVSVLEPVWGLAAIKKSRELLRGKTLVAGELAFWYLSLYVLIAGAFGLFVVLGEELGFGMITRVVVGATLVVILVVVNMIALLAQSVVYYVCKSYHGEEIDRTLLYEHLGAYLGEYVSLKSSLQIQDLDPEEV